MLYIQLSILGIFLALTLPVVFGLTIAVALDGKKERGCWKLGPKSDSWWINKETGEIIKVELTIIHVFFKRYSIPQEKFLTTAKSGMQVSEFYETYSALKDPDEEIERQKGLQLLQDLDNELG